ncbi:MAG: ComEC/Rec2 family competence protein [Kofleriaceae bacterium]
MRVRPGDVVALEGALRSPAGRRNPGGFDRRAAARWRGIDAEVGARHLEVVGVDGGEPWRWADGVRQRWSAALGDGPGSALTRAAVVGDRGDVDDATDARWRAAGVYHALSVSGLHLAVVAGLLFALLRRLVAASPLGRRGRPEAWAAAPSLLAAGAYTLITGAELATLRALLVVTIVVVGRALGRPTRVLDALAVAAAVLLLVTPSVLLDPSFQLSFTAATVLALLPGGGPRVGGWLRRGVGVVGRLLAASAWVTAATAPITAAHFHEIAWGGVVGNLVVTPVLELAEIPVTLGALVLAPIAPGLAAVAIDAAVAATAAADHVAGVVGAATPVAIVVPPSTLELVAFAAGFAALLGAARRCWRWRRGGAVALAALLVLVAARLSRDTTARTSTTLRLTFVDVGQGDAAIVEVPGGEVWLVDAGGNPGAPTPAAGRAPRVAVARVLRWLGHQRVDLAIVTHPHPDHYLGLGAVAAAMPIAEVWIPEEEEAPAHGGELAELLAMLARAGTVVRAPPAGAGAGGRRHHRARARADPRRRSHPRSRRPGALRQRQLAGGVDRLRRPAGALARRRRGRGRGRAARRARGAGRGGQGRPPREPDLVGAGAGRRYRRGDRGHLVRPRQPVRVPRRRGGGALGGRRRHRPAHRPGRRDRGDHRRRRRHRGDAVGVVAVAVSRRAARPCERARARAQARAREQAAKSAAARHSSAAC